MGAQTFRATGIGSTSADAFHDAVTAARAIYRDEYPDGYSGTIAEKQSFVEWPLPGGWRDRPRHEIEWMLDDLCDWLSTSTSARLDADLVDLVGPDDARQMLDAFTDKWGPALAFPTGEAEWTFMGWASC